VSPSRRATGAFNVCCALAAALGLAAAAVAARTLEFGGYTWQVHRGSGGPGPNLFSDSTDNVFIDAQGRLHLKIRKVGNAWICSELYTLDPLGYGTYRFHLASDAERYDPRIVVGLFTYQDDQHEIDIELTRQGDEHAPAGNFTVQPWFIPGNMAKFELGSHATSTHLFDWRPDAIFFESVDGYGQPPEPGAVIYDWNYAGDSIPRAGTEKLYINFYLFQGVPPANQSDAELIVTDVSFTPAALLPVPWLAFGVQQGQLVAGDLGSVAAVDDQALQLDASLVNGRYTTSAVFEGVSVAAPLTRLDLTVYASSSEAGTAAVQLYDFAAARYVNVGAMPLTDANLWQRFTIPDPAPYLRAGDGHVRTRLVSRSNVATYRLRVDELRIDGAQ
jgi:hypothetical protein